MLRGGGKWPSGHLLAFLACKSDSLKGGSRVQYNPQGGHFPGSQALRSCSAPCWARKNSLSAAGFSSKSCSDL